MALKSVPFPHPDNASIATAESERQRAPSDGFYVRLFVEDDRTDGLARQTVEQALKVLGTGLIEIIDPQHWTIRRTIRQILKLHGSSSEISKPLSTQDL